MNRHAALERRRENIETFVHAVATNSLYAEKFAGLRREQHLQRNRLSAWIISSVRAGMQMQG